MVRRNKLTSLLNRRISKSFKLWHIIAFLFAIIIIFNNYNATTSQSASLVNIGGQDFRLAYPVMKAYRCEPSGPEQSFYIHSEGKKISGKIYCTNSVSVSSQDALTTYNGEKYDELPKMQKDSGKYSIPYCHVYVKANLKTVGTLSIWQCDKNDNCYEYKGTLSNNLWNDIGKIGQTTPYEYIKFETGGLLVYPDVTFRADYVPYGLHLWSTTAGYGILKYPTCDLSSFLDEQGKYDWKKIGGSDVVNGYLGFDKQINIIEYWNDVSINLNSKMRQSAYNPQTQRLCLDHKLWTVDKFANYYYPKQVVQQVDCCPGEIVGTLMCGEDYTWSTTTGSLEGQPCMSDIEMPDVPYYGENKVEKWHCINGKWERNIVAVECIENADCPDKEGMVKTCIDYECRYSQSAEYIKTDTLDSIFGNWNFLKGLQNWLKGIGLNLDLGTLKWVFLFGIAFLVIILLSGGRGGGRAVVVAR
ncbi:MAG: hypothetical protein J7K29_03110 [Candidatus Cloacimonetes bacterium]|nr:hypothetical protein [Candidatus Cloacimonadota bacterium]